MKNTNKFLMAIFFAFLLVLISCNDDTVNSPETQDIDGIITNAAGQAIANATVTALNIENIVLAIDTTNTEGYFLLSKLPDNLEDIEIMVVKSGYNIYRTAITNIKSQNEGSLPSIQMTESKDDTCCKGILYVYPKNKDNNETIQKGVVKLWKNDKLIESVEFKEGVAVFDGICESSYSVSVFADGYTTMEFTYEHPCNETIEKTALVEKTEENDCCGLITVCVHEKVSNAIINDVEIRLNQDKEIIAKKHTSSKEACVTFENICEGIYWIRIYHADYKVIETDFYLGECDTIEIDKLIEKKTTEEDTCCKGILYVYPKDSKTKESIKTGTVKIWKNGQLLETLTVKEGKATIDGLCEGKYGVDIYSEGYQTIEFEYEHPCNQTIEKIKYLEKK